MNTLHYTRLIEVLKFNPENGEIFWLASNKMAGTLSKKKGYRIICIDRKLYKAHRLMWFYVHKEWPTEIDHINCKKDDNRISNLREVNSSSENRWNLPIRKTNTSGYKNVSFHRGRGRWQVRIGKHYKRIALGYFDSKEEAYAAYCAAVKQYHGQFARTA